jgi:threonine/homoserine/homoserine lactone efflux protein
MPSLDLLIAFAVATLIFAFMPGPAMLYAAAQTVARGRKGGFMAAFGIHCGGYVHVLGAMLGLSALFEHVPVLYTAIKIAGALYLVWLGIAMIRAKPDGEALPKIAARGPYQAFAGSIAVEVLNPKAALFFLAFLPQFVNAGANDLAADACPWHFGQRRVLCGRYSYRAARLGGIGPPPAPQSGATDSALGRGLCLGRPRRAFGGFAHLSRTKDRRHVPFAA